MRWRLGGWVGVLGGLVAGLVTFDILTDAGVVGILPELGVLGLSLAGVYFSLRERRRRRQVEDFTLQVNAALREGVTVVYSDGRIRYANAVCAETLGYTLDELYRLKSQQFCHPEDLPILMAAGQRRASGQSEIYRYRVLHRSGEAIPVEVNAVPWYQGGRIVGSIANIRDLRPEEKDRQAIARLNQVLRGVAEANRMLLRHDHSADQMGEVLGVLGQAVRVDRVYINEFHREPGGPLRVSQRYEWCGPGVVSTLGRASSQNREPIPLFYQQFQQGQPVTHRHDALPPELQADAGLQDVLSFLAVPIWVQGELWGSVGFCDSKEAREWRGEEVAALKTIASSLGDSIGRARSEGRFRALVETSPDGIIEVDAAGTILYCNASYLRLVGAERPQEVVGQPVTRFLHPDYHQTVMARIGSADPLAPIPFIEERYVRLDGTLVPVEVGAARIAPDRSRLMAIVRDVSRHKEAEGALRASEARFRALVQHSFDVTLIVDAAGRIRYASPNAARLRLCQPEAEGPPSVYHYLSPEDAERCRELLGRLRAEPGETVHAEVNARLERGGLGWFEVWGQNQLANPAVGGIVLNVRDIGERKAYQSTIEHLAYHDALTGLPNRRMLREQADHFLAQARRAGREATLIYLDLDRFKEVNDTLGHEAGDDLLVQVARRIQHCVRGGDLLARLGGDEFAILLGETGVEGATDAAQRVLDALQQPFGVADATLRIGASLGLGVFPRDGQSLEDLMRVADVAMYRAKEHGAGLMFYSPELDRYSRERLNLIQDLREALAAGEIYLEYQPILDTHSGRWIKAEALARWRHPLRGLIPPAQFIPLAEETGLIRELDRRVLGMACREAGLLGLSVSVNISPRTLHDADFVETVRAALLEGALEPDRLHIEITETALIQNLARAVQHLSALRQMGVRIALDDFGVGTTSMGYLKDLPIDLLKIDRSFVHGIGRDLREEAILRSILLLGEGLGLRTVAEGVETPEQMSWLLERGCHLLQGFGIARPQPKENLVGATEPVLRG